MKIQEVSQKTGMKKRTIHFYIKEDLLSPSINKENGYYDFHEEDIQQLILISKFRNAGFPISMIRSIIKEPATASYYLSNYLSTLRKQKEYLEKTIESIKYVINNLPLQIHLDTLYQAMLKAQIPAAVDKEELRSTPKDSSVLNRYLWSPFIPDDLQNDFQEFLWAKINLLVSESDNTDYETLSRYLDSLQPKELEELYKGQRIHFAYVVSLDDKGCHSYVETLKQSISQNLKKPQLVNHWKRNYHSFYLPSMRIYDSSKEQSIISQISPFFAKYRENIHKVCTYLYEDLQNQDTALLEQMYHILGDFLDLECCHHAALEAFSSIRFEK